MKKYLIFLLILLSRQLIAAQIQPVKDINPGTAAGILNWSRQTTAQIGDLLFFWAQDGQHGIELWVSDGTEAGTYLLADIWPGPGSAGNPLSYMISMGETLFFVANDSLHGMELWKYEVGSTGPVLLADMLPGPEGSYPNLFADEAAKVFQNRLYFNGSNKGKSQDRELWCTDGDSVFLVKNIHPGQTQNGWLSSFPSAFLVYEDHLYFSAHAPNSGREVWRTDGTTDSTRLVLDIWPGKNDGGWNGPVVFQGEMFFVGRHGIPGSTGTSLPGFEVWKSDGTEAGTVLLKNIHPSGNGIDFHLPYHFVEYQQHLYFLANDSLHGFEVWKTDGTEAGTHLLKDIHPWDENVSAGWNSGRRWVARVLANKLYFIAYDAINTNQAVLWETDGTDSGTIPSLDSWIGPMALEAMVEYEGRFFSAGEDLTVGTEVWWSNGMDSAQPVQDLQPGTQGSFPRDFYILNNRLVFPARHPLYGFELLTLDPSTVGIDDAPLPVWHLYPNPVRDILIISAREKIQSIALLSLRGDLIQVFTIDAFEASLDLPFHLPTGVYLLQLTLEDQQRFYRKILLNP